MSIRISCRDCGAEYPVSDEMAGRTVRCRECDARVDVPDDDERATSLKKLPRSNRGDARADVPDDDEPRPRRSRKRAKKSDNTTMILLIVGGVLCLACVFCSGAGIVGYLVVNKGVQAVNEQLNAGLIPPGKGPIILNQQSVVQPNDPMRDGHPTKTFAINLQQGKTYVIDMRSAEIDCYLLIFDPNNVKVAEDDDSGGGIQGLDARVRLTANRTGNYTIGCSVFAVIPPGGGHFTVTVRED